MLEVKSCRRRRGARAEEVQEVHLTEEVQEMEKVPEVQEAREVLELKKVH